MEYVFSYSVSGDIFRHQITYQNYVYFRIKIGGGRESQMISKEDSRWHQETPELLALWEEQERRRKYVEKLKALDSEKGYAMFRDVVAGLELPPEEA